MPKQNRPPKGPPNQWWSWEDRPESSSPLPADGIKAKARAGQAFGQTWWGGKWIAALERLVNPGRLQRGRYYARRGQVLNIDFAGNRVESSVQGSRKEPYKVSIEIKSIDDQEWQNVIDVMASQAIFAAKLLAGEMPQDIEEAFSAARVALFPARTADLKTECSCPDYANPCKHISAVYYLLGEQFDADPFLLFQLRGRSKEHIIEELRTRRGRLGSAGEGLRDQAEEGTGVDAATAGMQEESEIRFVHEEGPPLEDLVHRFWDGNPEIESMEFSIARPEVDAAPIKRLGQPEFWAGKGDFISEMESIYRAISESAIKTALGD
jgi:uncharacterized Zn finger protein